MTPSMLTAVSQQEAMMEYNQAGIFNLEWEDISCTKGAKLCIPWVRGQV